MLKKISALNVKNAVDGEKIEKGYIYVAPPNQHLIIEDGKLRTVFGPKENRFRPAVDPLFRSAAYSYDSNVIGIILSGSLNDGTAGLWTVKDQGGITIVQDPQNAPFKDMPLNAIKYVDIDYQLPVNEIAPFLVKLSSQKPDKNKKSKSAERKKLEVEVEMMKNKVVKDENINHIGEKSHFTCPECHGPLWKIEDDKIIRFRCRIGHAYSPETFLAEQNEYIEKSTWTALQALKENYEFLLDVSKKRDDKKKYRFYDSKITAARKKAEIMHKLILEEKVQEIFSVKHNCIKLILYCIRLNYHTWKYF